MPSPVRAVLGAVVGLILLAGCSTPANAPASAPGTGSAPSSSAPAQAGSSNQSLSEACLALEVSMTESASTLQAATSEIGSDPGKAVKALHTFQDSFEQAVAKVSNPELKAQADKSLAAAKKFVSAVEDMVKDPTKAMGFSDVMKEFQTEMEKIDTVCRKN